MAIGQSHPSKPPPKADFDKIPLIDLSTLKSSDLAERQKLAHKVYEACTQVGFFYIKVISSFCR